MSDMKAQARKKAKATAKHPTLMCRREFTVRDLNRHTAELLAAARQHGSVTVFSRTGESYVLVVNRPEVTREAGTFEDRMRRHHTQLVNMGKEGPDQEAWEIISKAIAGEV